MSILNGLVTVFGSFASMALFYCYIAFWYEISRGASWGFYCAMGIPLFLLGALT